MSVTGRTLNDVVTSYATLQDGDLMFVERGGSAGKSTYAQVRADLATRTFPTWTVTSADINGGTIDGTAIGATTPAAGTFTTINATGEITSARNAGGALRLIDTDGPSTHAHTFLFQNGSTFEISTATVAGVGVNVDYLMTKGTTGATQHSFRVAGTERLRIEASPAVTITGSLSASGAGSFTGGLNTNAILTLTGNPDIGSSTLGRFGTIFLVNAPNVSSDARLKSDIADLTDKERAAAAKIKARTFIMNGQKKVGYIAQEVIEAMASEGLSAFEYGLVTEGEFYGVDMDAINAFRLG